MIKSKRKLGEVNFLGRPIQPAFKHKHKHSQPIFGFKPVKSRPQPMKGYPGINMFSSIAIPQRQSTSLWNPSMNRPAAAMWGDKDGDGVYNGFDCQPRNRKKQGLYHSLDLNSTGPRGFGPEEWRAMQLESYKQTKKHPIREMATMGVYSDLAARHKMTKMMRESPQEMINKTEEFDADQRERNRLEKEFKRSREWSKKHPILSSFDGHGVAAVMATKEEKFASGKTEAKMKEYRDDSKIAKIEARKAKMEERKAQLEEKHKAHLEKMDEFMDKRAEHKKFMEERKEAYKEKKDAKNVERIEKSQARMDAMEKKDRKDLGRSANPSAQDLIDEVS